MPGKARLYILIAIMAVVAITSSLVAGWVQYDAAFSKKKALLISIVKYERSIIEDKLNLQERPLDRNLKTFLPRLKQHIKDDLKFDKFGDTGAILIAQLVDKKIHFLLSSRNTSGKTQVLDFESPLAEPMHRALLGFSGVIIGKDYLGKTVLAAYEPLGNMGLGIVAKIDIAEIREPFIKAGLIAAIAAIALMFVGAILFFSIINPILRKAKANEEEFRNLYDRAPVMMHSIDRHGRIRYANKQWLDFMGYEAHEVIGKKIFDFQTSPSASISQKAVADLAETGKVSDIALQFVKKSGEIRDVLVTAVSQRNTNEGFDDSVSVTTDITDQKRTESLLKQAVESFSSGFALFDANERLVLCNQNYKNALSHIGDILEPGISKLALLRAAVARGKIPAAKGREEAWLEERLQAFREHENTYIRQTYDGKWIKVDNFKTADGGTVLLRNDITKLRRAENALRASETRFRKLIESASQGILVHSYRKPLYANQAFATMYGYDSPEEITALDTTEALIAPEYLTNRHERRLAGEPISPDMVYEGIRKDGTRFWAEKRTFLIEWDGEIASCSVRIDIDERKKTEETLKNNEAQFRAFIDNLPMAVNITDTDNRYVMVNKLFKEWYGHGTRDVLSKTRGDIFGPEQNETTKTVRAHIQDVISTKKQIIQYRKRTLPDGRAIDLEVNKFPIFDEKGNVIRVGSITTDVTERLRAEQALRDSEERFRGAIESLQEGFALYDKDDRLVICNEEYLRLHPNSRDMMKPGMKFEDMVRHNVYSGINADALGQEEEHLRERLERHRNPTGPIIRKLSNGTWFIINESRTPEGGYCVTEIDITELKQIEAALRSSEARFRTLFDSSNQGLLVHRDQKPLYANQTLAEIYGYDSTEEIMALTSTEALIAPEDRDQAKAMHSQRLQGKPSPLDWEYRGLKKNGEKIWVGKRAFFIDWDGETAICSVRFDITERKRAEQALRESEERFRTLFNSSPQGILVHRQHKPLYANQALADMYGYDAIAEVLSMRTTLDLIAPESRSPTGDAWLLAKADSFDKEYLGVKKDGEKIWVQKRSFRINWDGKPAICSMRTNITQRKETEERIRKSEEQFRLAIANLQEAFALYDSDDRLVIYNDEFVRLHPAATDIIKPGVTWKEIMLKTLEKGRNALALGREEEYIQEREDLHKNPKGPILRHNTDGKWRIINEVKLPDGGTVVVQTDITELKKLEEEALKAQKLLQSAIESIASGFSLYDSEGRLTLANTNNYEYFKDVRDVYRPGALFEDVLRARAKRGLIDGVEGDVEKWVQERMKRFLSRKTTSHLRRDRGRWMQVNEYPTGDGGKAIIRTDITESKEVMDALRVSEERFKTLVDSSNQGILIHRHYKPLYANNALAKIFGYDSAAEIMTLSSTKTLLKRRSKHDDGPLRLHDARLRGEPVPDEYEFRTARKDGSPIWVNNRAFRIEWEGEPAICTTLFDITERKFAESQLIQSSKLASLGELASSIAHELNQPLGVMRIVAESALIKTEESKTLNLDYARKQLTAICDQAERMASITNHLRLFSRLDEGEVTLFDPSESIQNAVNLIEQPFRLSGIKFIKKTPNESRQILGSNIKLEQVILNLLNNAADAVNDRAEHEDDHGKKYTPRVSVTLTDNKRSQSIIIRIKDNGGGIPQENLQKIFDPFFTTKAAGHGTGLGLSISFGIVKSMQGILDVENHSDGALFTITLPAQQQMEIPIKQNKALPAKPASGRANGKNAESYSQNTVTGKHNGNGKAKGNGKLPFVIVVDDELLAAESIAEHLQYSGYTVFTANNGAEALSLCKKDIPDAVITDLRMPVMDGFALIRELKAKHPKLPIIVTTGHTNLEDEDAAVTGGAAVVLWKPIKLNDLTRKLSELIN